MTPCAPHTALAVGYTPHPERLVRQAPMPTPLPAAAWINKPEQTPEAAHSFPGRPVSKPQTGSVRRR